ncbi:glycolate oxidase FAD binding subunit [Nitrosomonas cryotolerans]|uniref:Glycolate oxidase FAD binding subunit n=1 Tax=Nitrosomonas cryotolerans ATCC 49181 TaxID=1131553 RepID=A0A1N6FPJ8_9PROT|nr:glycolate oxidase subunit GlcE [Nitrosomonas cryotolerans]SFP78774.1 glycolate oxidase FAD binding subunit [Nitrosomonas cryotolerans]SIN97184.1 glycolate oxidase FAD binding subunit [Nitrosomonas cryotolerans ATCC 49181]
MQAIVDQFVTTILGAAKCRLPLRIRGGGSKHFYGNTIIGQNNDTLDISPYSGIIDYEPTELVVTARAGTRLADLSATLRNHGQMLAFEPPHFGATATLGGCVAAGLSGPRRASAGAVRDFVLGIRMLDGRGNDLRFGGQVMKNVAGYDVSRLMAGSMGTLGVLLEVSLKVLPLPPAELTLRMQMNAAEAMSKMNEWAGKPLPISATCFCGDELMLRLSGAESAVRAAHAKLGGEELVTGSAFWESVREQTHSYFHSAKSLWRLSIKSTAAPLSLPGQQLIEWSGALRWLVGSERINAEMMHTVAKEAEGHATLFRSGESCVSVFHPLDPAMMRIHRLLKEKFDPVGIFNPGRLYPGL